jgi:hypothetical protein
MQDRWTIQIDEITNNFKQAFGSLTIEQLNWKSNTSVWSIAQNIDHLIVINSTYYPVISDVRNGTYKLPFLAKFNFMVSVLGQTILKSVQPDRKKRIKTFPIWEPSTSNLKEDIVERFERHQTELKKLIETSTDLLDKKTVISSPANRNIVYTLETAFDIILTHERRHYEQAMEIKKMQGL